MVKLTGATFIQEIVPDVRQPTKRSSLDFRCRYVGSAASASSRATGVTLAGFIALRRQLDPPRQQRAHLLNEIGLTTISLASSGPRIPSVMFK